ncbi:hypothetical protein K1719_031649 [Acacia pycnantha]|nr:hypothetical protein K1719_031649 [Acacia pycnantha]
MVINLSSSPPSYSTSITRLANYKSPFSARSFKLNFDFPKPHSSRSSICYSFASPHINLTCKKRFLSEKSRCTYGNRVDFRTWAISGFDYGNFEGPQSVLEAVVVLTANLYFVCCKSILCLL